MPKIKYQEFNFRHDTLLMIERCNQILNNYHRQGYDMTLRQLYYQLVAADVIPNQKESYDNLGQLIGKARLAGLIDWNQLVDRNRALRGTAHYDSPASRIKLAAHGYAIDKWADQKYRPELWVEKEALAGVFARVCSELDIDYFSCKGYTSLSEMWRASNRMRDYYKAGQTPVIIHFGDHDPSGIDMTRDIFDRLQMFNGGVEVERLALNMNQVQKYNPPPNPAKITDSRAKVYIQKFGRESWELDALEPTVLGGLVRDFVLNLRDEKKWQAKVDEENDHIKKLHLVSDKFNKATWFLNGSFAKPFYCGCPTDCNERVAIQGEISDDCAAKCVHADCYEMSDEDTGSIYCAKHLAEQQAAIDAEMYGDQYEDDEEPATCLNCDNDAAPGSDLCYDCEDISENDE